MKITLTQMLDLVGKLDDTPGEDTPRERFRKALHQNIKDVGPVRDHLEECLRTSGPQYNRALQDLVNFIGTLLEFEVTYGRYQGVQGEIGFDGHWKSPTGFHLVVEVKTTEVYSIKASTLVGYVDEMISSGIIPDWDNALGLYVIGRPDPDLRQLENSIVAEKRTAQLRIISVESLLSVAELLSQFDITHKDILDILLPAGPRIDPLVGLMSRLVAQRESSPIEKKDKEPVEDGQTVDDEKNEATRKPNYWLTPVKSTDEESAEDCIKKLVGEIGVYGFGDKTPGRKSLRIGDWICFYAASIGVVAHAQVTSQPKREPDPRFTYPESYPWTFTLNNSKLYIEKPIVIDAELRTGLEAFDDRSPSNPWSWFVQATHKVSEKDFKLLTKS